MPFKLKFILKKPEEVAMKSLKNAITAFSATEEGHGDSEVVEQTRLMVSKYLNRLKCMITAVRTGEDKIHKSLKYMSAEFFKHDILLWLIINLTRIEFEGRKDVVTIFNNIMRYHLNIRSSAFADYILLNPQIVCSLVSGYGCQEIALLSGMMLQEIMHHEEIAKMFLHSEQFDKLISYIHASSFDIAFDAFKTFKRILLNHGSLVAEFLKINYENFFTKYQQLIVSRSYVTRLQSLKLLGDILLSRQNFSVMTRYISLPENLKIMMKLLHDPSQHIQFESFNIFKIFVVNPNKAEPIANILLRNKMRLLNFLAVFQTDRDEEDVQFHDEKKYLFREISGMGGIKSLQSSKIFCKKRY